jgi:D-galactose 1-dehydrogenase
MNRMKIALVGIGKIAREQHLPALAASSAFDLVAVVSPHSQLAGVPNFPTVAQLLDTIPSVEAVSICTPPQVRYDVARVALAHGKHVMLEKPPGATLSEVASLVDIADRHRVSLFATWHSRAATAVEPARSWLAARAIRIAHVYWKQDVRTWYPKQPWIWHAGGFGVFDPGIDALSIVTRIMPVELALRDAELLYPSNCDTPIAARLLLEAQGASVRAEFEFLQTGPQTWDIDVETDEGRLLLSHGGSMMHINGNSIVVGSNREYARLYAQFETLIRERRSDVDLAPLRLVADAFLSGRRVTVAPFVARAAAARADGLV